MNGLLGNEHLCVCVSRGVPVCTLATFACGVPVCARRVRVEDKFSLSGTLCRRSRSRSDPLSHGLLSESINHWNKPKDGGRYGMDGGVTDTTIHRPLIGRSDFKTKGRGAWAVRVGGAGARWGAPSEA